LPQTIELKAIYHGKRIRQSFTIFFNSINSDLESQQATAVSNNYHN